MRFRIVLYAALALVALAERPAVAQETQCIFQNHSKAVVFLKYTYRSRQTNEEYSEQGTGFLVDKRGHVITVNHAVAVKPGMEAIPGSEKIEARVGGFSERSLSASILRRDPDMDLALLKLPSLADPYAFVTIGKSAVLDVGDRLMGMGFPQSDLAVIPAGEITSPNAVVADQLKPFWQTSLALTGGHSGSPVFGKLGAVVGVAAAVRRDAQIISYVIPVQYASVLLKNAEVETSRYGPCAVFPACRHPDHGVEAWETDENIGEWGGWRSGGYTRTAYCNDLHAIYRGRYPNAQLTKIRDDEQSRKTWDGHAQYKYYCEFNRKEKPLYVARESAICLDARFQ